MCSKWHVYDNAMIMYGGPQGQNTTQFLFWNTTIFSRTQRNSPIHNNPFQNTIKFSDTQTQTKTQQIETQQNFKVLVTNPDAESERNLGLARHVVADLMREMDPEGCELRRAKSLKRRSYFSSDPNYTWHVDGYDKLKPYWFPIHGCIDGWSRKIMWLTVT